jgi:hypothetical protein
MAQADFSSDSGAPAAGPFPLGDTGWMAGDFRNGSGLLGLTPPPSGAYPGPTGIGSSSAPWSAGNPAAQPGDSPAEDDDDASSNDDDSPADADESSSDDAPQTDQPDFGGWTPQNAQGAHLDYGLATWDDAHLFLTGANDTLKRQWERREGRSWPTTEDGRSYHAHHKVARADGGAHDLSNIEPKHPDEHIAHHIANGDFSRWAKRAWLRGRVQPGAPRVPQIVRPQYLDPGNPEADPPVLLQLQPGPRPIGEPNINEESD